jgi:hypothetical protein
MTSMHLSKERALRVHLLDALDAVLEPREVLSAPVNLLLVFVDFTPCGRRCIITSDSVREGRCWVVGTRSMEERPLVSA